MAVVQPQKRTVQETPTPPMSRTDSDDITNMPTPPAPVIIPKVAPDSAKSDSKLVVGKSLRKSGSLESLSKLSTKSEAVKGQWAKTVFYDNFL